MYSATDTNLGLGGHFLLLSRRVDVDKVGPGTR